MLQRLLLVVEVRNSEGSGVHYGVIQRLETVGIVGERTVWHCLELDLRLRNTVAARAEVLRLGQVAARAPRPRVPGSLFRFRPYPAIAPRHLRRAVVKRWTLGTLARHQGTEKASCIEAETVVAFEVVAVAREASRPYGHETP